LGSLGQSKKNLQVPQVLSGVFSGGFRFISGGVIGILVSYGLIWKPLNLFLRQAKKNPSNTFKYY
jgi:hypothetical protein